VGFEVVLGPEFLHGAFAHPGVAGHGTHAPAAAGRRGLDHLAQDHVDLLRVQPAGASRPGLVFQGGQAGAGVTVAPLAHRVNVEADLGGDSLIGPTLSGQQHHLGALPLAVLDALGPRPLLQRFLFVRHEPDRRGNNLRHPPCYPQIG
jgi:hypothetical protein